MSKEDVILKLLKEPSNNLLQDLAHLFGNGLWLITLMGVLTNIIVKNSHLDGQL